jgi:hypothetical protein
MIFFRKKKKKKIKLKVLKTKGYRGGIFYFLQHLVFSLHFLSKYCKILLCKNLKTERTYIDESFKKRWEISQF